MFWRDIRPSNEPHGWTSQALLAIVWRMIDPKLLDELSERLAASVPSGIRNLQEDLAKQFRANLEAGLARLNLVTREEFDVQTAVLARTREKLSLLEQQVKTLESQRSAKSD